MSVGKYGLPVNESGLEYLQNFSFCVTSLGIKVALASFSASGSVTSMLSAFQALIRMLQHCTFARGIGAANQDSTQQSDFGFKREYKGGFGHGFMEGAVQVHQGVAVTVAISRPGNRRRSRI